MATEMKGHEASKSWAKLLATSDWLKANNELMQAVGMPSAQSNNVRVGGNLKSGYLALGHLGVSRRKVGKVRGPSRFGNRMENRPQRHRGIEDGGQLATSTTAATGRAQISWQWPVVNESEKTHPGR